MDNQIMILDQATANIDLKTEEKIQKFMKTELKEKTVISIAHRLLSVIDFDKIIVMEDGQIAERGKAKELYDHKGLFYEMVQNSSDRREITEKIYSQY